MTVKSDEYLGRTIATEYGDVVFDSNGVGSGTIEAEKLVSRVPGIEAVDDSQSDTEETETPKTTKSASKGASAEDAPAEKKPTTKRATTRRTTKKSTSKEVPKE